MDLSLYGINTVCVDSAADIFVVWWWHFVHSRLRYSNRSIHRRLPRDSQGNDYVDFIVILPCLSDSQTKSLCNQVEGSAMLSNVKDIVEKSIATCAEVGVIADAGAIPLTTVL